MIVTEKQRFYTDKTGHLEKAIFMTCYRKPNTAISSISDNPSASQNNQSLRSCFKIVFSFIIVAFIIAYGLIRLCDQKIVEREENLFSKIKFFANQEAQEIKDFGQFLRQAETPSSIQQYKNNRSIDASSLQRILINNLVCRWEGNNILCQAQVPIDQVQL